jgi:type I restriction enzyme S subunit
LVYPGDFKYEGILKDSKRKVNEFAIESNQVEIFPENTVYLIGIGGTIGKIGMSYLSASANQQINAIIFREKIYPEFGFYFLKNSKHQVDLLADFTTLPILNQAKTKEIIVGIPPIPEQKNIVEYIEQETAQISTIIQTIEKEIALVQEYRTALIAEAVTGKIDVRDYEIPETPIVELYEELEDEMSLVAEEEVEYLTEN